MLCKNCNCEIPDESRFCLNCGANVREGAENIKEDTEEKIEETVEDTTEEINEEVTEDTPENTNEDSSDSTYSSYAYSYTADDADAQILIYDEETLKKHKRRKLRSLLFCAAAAVVIIAFTVTMHITGSARLEKTLKGVWTCQGNDLFMTTSVMSVDDETLSIDNTFSSFFSSGVTGTFEYKVISPSKIKLYADGESVTLNVRFNDERTKMQITPSLTSKSGYDRWEKQSSLNLEDSQSSSL